MVTVIEQSEIVRLFNLLQSRCSEYDLFLEARKGSFSLMKSSEPLLLGARLEDVERFLDGYIQGVKNGNR